MICYQLEKNWGRRNEVWQIQITSHKIPIPSVTKNSIIFWMTVPLKKNISRSQWGRSWKYFPFVLIIKHVNHKKVTTTFKNISYQCVQHGCQAWNKILSLHFCNFYEVLKLSQHHYNISKICYFSSVHPTFRILKKSKIHNSRYQFLSFWPFCRIHKFPFSLLQRH